MLPKSDALILPRTIDEAVDLLLSDLPLRDRTRLSAMTEEELYKVNSFVGEYIASEFRLLTGNNKLLESCLSSSETDDDASMVIIRKMWKKLQETHVLRLVV